MMHPGCSILFLWALLLVASHVEAESSECPVTVLNGGLGGMLENDALDVILPGSKIVFRPGGGGFVLRDGALALKFGWNRKKEGRLTISGRRLDGSAPPLRARIPDGYGDIGFQSTAIAFPTPGCWEVTGRIPDGELTFVIMIEKVGDGPEGRDDW